MCMVWQKELMHAEYNELCVLDDSIQRDTLGYCAPVIMLCNIYQYNL